VIPIQFPEPTFKIVQQNGQHQIWDAYRKKYVVLTPEEWVRQNFMTYLVQTLKYPSALIALEREILLGTLKKRCDIVVYNREMQPWMIVECKEMKVPLSENVLDQVIRYHLAIPATYLVITNGQHTFCCHMDKFGGKATFMQELPVYP